MNFPEAVLNDKGVKVFEKLEGSGDRIVSDRRVKIHYIGYFENGEVFETHQILSDAIESVPGQGLLAYPKVMVP